MECKINVDGIDIYAAYGISIADEGLNGLIAFNTTKEPDINDWPEEDGIEVDLSDLKLENKAFGISFNGKQEGGVELFLGLMDETPYHDFEFIGLNITRRLRLVSMPSRTSIQPFKNFELQFTDDSYPFTTYVRTEPIRVANCYQKGFEIDDKLISDYGIWIHGAVGDEILKAPDVKPNLTIDPISINGAMYDSEGDVVFNSRDITLNCHIRADIPVFWNNWNTFFYDITRNGSHNFFFEERNHDYPFYYKRCSVDRFQIINNEIWCDFTITLCFTSLRIGDVWHLLAVIPQGLIELDPTGLMVDTTLLPSKNPS